jgi:PAS domain S-box-containing protein
VLGALCQELGVRWVLVTRVDPGGTATPYAAVQDGDAIEWPPYPIAGTPCQEVLDRKTLVYHASGVRHRFPESVFLAENRVDSYVGVPLWDSQGLITGLLCAFHDSPLDIEEAERDLLDLYARRLAGETERVQTEQSLSEARRALETLIQNLPGAVYRCASRSERPVAYVSPGCEAVTGYSPGEFGGDRGVSLGDLVVPEDRARAWREIRAAVAGGKPYEIEYRIHDARGEVRWVFDVGRAVDGEAGDPNILEGVLFDHTERRSLEAQLSHSQRMEALGRLAGGVAHDFNNLLTAISGYAELLTMGLPPDRRTERAAEEILRASDRAADLTRQLLAFGRRQVTEPKVVDLNDAVRGVARMLDRVLGEDILFELELAPTAGSVRADPGQLEQVVMNLVVNARDAMPDGGRLVIRTGSAIMDETAAIAQEGPAPGEYALIEVTDTGTGIEPAVLGQIFEPFFTTKEEGKGTGLGLATVYGIVRQAGGHVTVRSEFGEGTTFRVHLPWCAEAGRVVQTDPATAAQPGQGERLVLVEDEEAVRRVATEHLEGRGYAVADFASGVEALGALEEIHEVDALVTDVVMPGMGGLELARRMRERWPDLPVIYVSGHAGDAIPDLGAAGSNTVFLQKPFRLADLEQSVRSAVALDGNRA